MCMMRNVKSNELCSTCFINSLRAFTQHATMLAHICATTIFVFVYANRRTGAEIYSHCQHH